MFRDSQKPFANVVVVGVIGVVSDVVVIVIVAAFDTGVSVA